MKTNLNIIAFLLYFISFSQESNSIKYSNININGISINQSKNFVISNLNLIDSGTIYLDEIANEENTIFTLVNNINDIKSEFYFNSDSLTNFDLLDSSFYLNNSNLKVGNTINSIQSIFPISYNSKSVINGVGFITVDILMEDNTLSDEKLIINYNSSTNIISSINKRSN
jgi:hypothetical protein